MANVYREDIADVELKSGNITRSFMNHAIGSGDALANRFGVRIFRDGEPVSVEDETVTGIFMAPDGTNYLISETSYPGSTGKSGNVAYVQLPEICYAVCGNFCLAVKLSGGNINGTMRIIDGTVSETGESGAVVPTSTIPTTADIIAAYEAAVADIGKSVRFDVTQSLTESQKAKARSNIDAALEEDSVRHGSAIKQVSNTQANKQPVIANYTVAAGSVNKSLVVNTSDSSFRHIEYTVTDSRILFVAGRQYSSNYPGWIVVDADNNVIDYAKDLANNTPFAVNISLPPDAAKVIVNAYARENSYIFEYTDRTIEAPEIKTNLKNIGGKIVQGKAYKVDKTTTDGDYCYLEAGITEGEYFITGRNMGKNFPLFILLDGSDNVIFYLGEDTNFNVTDYKITAPSGTKKLIVNTSTGFRYPMIKKHVPSTTENLDTVLNIGERDKKIGLVSVNPTVTYGTVVHFNQTTASDANYMHAEYSCTGGKTYYITGRNFSSNYPMIMFVNGDGDVCYTSGNALTNSKPYFDMKVAAPLDAVTLIVNSYKGWDIDIKVDGEETLYGTLQNQQLTGVYLGETPTKEIEYDLVEGSWVYNSAKAERNLSKFGYAYAIMLERIMKTYPTATVICCTMNECERTTGIDLGFPERNCVYETVADYNNVIEKLAKAFGAMIVDHHSCGITYYNIDSYMSDYSSSTGEGLHPNAAGMALIAQKTVKDLSGIDWTGKKVSVFGDSISTYNGTGSTYNYYPTGDVTAVSQTWWYKSLITELGMELLTNGSGGGRSVSTIREGHTSGRPKSGCNQDAIDALAVNGTDPDVIIIKQGVNDFGNVGSTGNRDLNGNYYFGGL